ncbi:MAG: 2-hydroxyacid dehydrogenase [Rhodobacterales bacterium]
MTDVTHLKLQSSPLNPSPPRILVSRRLPRELEQRLERDACTWINTDDRQLTRAELGTAIDAQRPDVLLVMATDRIDAEFVTALPGSVRAIATLSVGNEHIDVDAARARGIAILHTPGIHSNAVAEMAIMLLLCAARRAHEGERLIYEQSWQGWSPTQLLGRDVTGARLGVIGMGRIGQTIARSARCGFGMDIHYHNRSRLSYDHEDGATYHPRLKDLMNLSDFLILSAPSSLETRGILNARSIDWLPSGAVVVNISRGDLVNDDDLIDALCSGQVGAAGLDVFNGEPDIHPGYRQLPNVFLQPHQGSSTLGTRVRMGLVLLESILAFCRGHDVNRLI